MSQLPGPIQKRDILYGVKKASAESLAEMGRKFEQEGWLSDAADFYSQAKDTEALKKVRQTGVQDGDSFIVLKVSRYLGDAEQVRDLIVRCAENAEAAQKYRYAIKAWETVDMPERAEPSRAKIRGDGDVVAESEASVFIPESVDESSSELSEDSVEE